MESGKHLLVPHFKISQGTKPESFEFVVNTKSDEFAFQRKNAKRLRLLDRVIGSHIHMSLTDTSLVLYLQRVSFWILLLVLVVIPFCPLQ